VVPYNPNVTALYGGVVLDISPLMCREQPISARKISFKTCGEKIPAVPHDPVHSAYNKIIAEYTGRMINLIYFILARTEGVDRIV